MLRTLTTFTKLYLAYQLQAAMHVIVCGIHLDYQHGQVNQCAWVACVCVCVCVGGGGGVLRTSDI